MAYHYLKIDKEKCKGCGLCIKFCPVKHIALSKTLNKKGVRFAQAKKEKKCIGCGFCSLICPDNCIRIYEKKNK